MRIKSILIHYSLFTIPFFASAAVPQRWVVETSQVKPVVFEAIHGETLALEATFKSYGTDVSTSNMTAFLCWQTNGMKNVWWVTNAVTSGHSASVLFKPSMDPGVPVVNAYIGLSESTNNQLPSTLYHLPSISYRAAFTIRFRHGPGAVPNAIAAPVPILDLAHTVVVNPPWPTEADFAATTSVMKAELKGYVDDQIDGAGLVTPQSVTNAASAVIAASNLCTEAYADEKYNESKSYTDNAFKRFNSGNNCFSIFDYSNDGYLINFTREGGSIHYNNPWWFRGLCNVSLSSLKLTDQNNGYLSVDYLFDLETMDFKTAMTLKGNNGKISKLYPDNSPVATSNMVENIGFIKSEADPTVPAWAKAENPPASMPDNGLVLTNDAVKTKSGTAITASQVGAADAATVNQMGQSLNAMSAHLNAEDARFVSTNYDSVVRTPEAYVEIKINNNWQTIWREMTRWGKFVGNAFNWNTWQGFHAWSTNVMAQLETKAERCWGIYDSETGEISPDGFTQISSSNILIAANMSYKRVVDTANAIWVLECNQGTATFGGETNGYFRVKDGDGNTQFEIIKGNQRELGCDAGGITVARSGGNNVMTILYSVVANNHPTLKICTDLVASDWVAEGSSGCAGTVVWSGGSGAYVATVTVPASTPSAFVKATYLGGSETIINNVAPTKMQYIYIGNTKYAIGYTTIGGQGVMTLTPQ